jgi:hypothetical protein
MGVGTADPAIDEAARALGTDPKSNIDTGPQDVHDGDDAPLPSQLAMFTELVGGKATTSNTTRLVGGKIEVDRDFKKGEKVKFLITAEIGSVAFVDQRDGKTGQVIGAERRHSARILNVQVK